jgi:hypothetical protein
VKGTLKKRESHGEIQMMRGVIACIFLLASSLATAAENYLTGRISNVTFFDNEILLQLDTGRPGNCATTTYGWIKVSSDSKLLQSVVLGAMRQCLT